MKIIERIALLFALTVVMLATAGCGDNREKMLDGRWTTLQNLGEDGMNISFTIDFQFESKSHTGAVDMEYSVGNTKLTTCHVPMKWSLSDDGNVIRIDINKNDIRFSFTPAFSKLAEGTDVTQQELENEMRSQMTAALSQWNEEKIEEITDDTLKLSESGYTMVYKRVK